MPYANTVCHDHPIKQGSPACEKEGKWHVLVPIVDPQNI